ncbi:peptidoglycan DD-metalloendopeptidase family protein [Salininema proteolyticum]|uniref:Peptidoglycan DD-metalloendopeptidase family protein n=1 Tax=Salininema proteolyticum TaxID=1607685 RepID=A0ABV8TTA6_9ACTN
MSSVLLLLAAFATPAVAQSAEQRLDDVERRKAEVSSLLEGASEEVREAGQLLAEAEVELPGAEEALAVAEGLVAAAEIRSREAEDAVEEARAELESARKAEREAVDAVREARDERAEVFTSVYKGAEIGTLSRVMDSEDLGQAVDRLGYFQFLNESKQEAVEKVTLERTRARNAENAASRAKDAAEEAAQEAREAEEEAREQRDAAEAAFAEVKELNDTRADALAVAKSYEDEIERQYEDLKAESDELAAEIRAAQQAAADPGPGSGSGGPAAGTDSQFVLPVAGWKSSDFGYRADPFTGASVYHSGVDIAAGMGTGIHAGGPGTVIWAGWNGGYGNLTCIDHGGGIATCYGHQSQIHVSTGQYVDTDDVIGSIGSTGNSTGPHLHFEVRINGGQVDPVPYLPSCFCR